MGSINLKYFAIIFCALLGMAGAAYAVNPDEEEAEAVYVDPTYKNYAKTYWRLKKFNIENDADVDNFMLITECDLFKEFAHNEFEWRGIRKASKKFIESNKKDFPIHYRFVQPISIDEYDFERKGFHIAKEHALNIVNRFEMPSEALYQKICLNHKLIHGYPKSLALELTRPFTLNFFPYDENRAKELIKGKMGIFENLKTYEKSRETYLQLRQVFLVTKVRMFAYKPGDLNVHTEQSAAKILGVMQSVEIYNDKELTERLYKKDFVRKQKSRKKDF